MKLTSFHVALLLCRLTGIGPTLAKRLIDYKGEAENIFHINPEELLKINGIGQTHLRSISEWKEHKAALIKELNFVQKNRITPFIYGQDSYPLSLKYIDDPPTVFFQKSKVNWANPRIVAIVGTCSPTHHGISFCKMLIEELKAYNPIIVSGFARGIDITAHLEAIKMGMETVAVLGHGLNRFYPENHNKYVEKIQKREAFVTEFWSQDEFKPSNFLKRNRIIAGLAHTTIVIESGSRGGSLVTAKHALGYGREVFAVPGRVTDQKSQGCLNLVKADQARLISTAADLVSWLEWEKTQEKQVIQAQLFLSLTAEEQLFYDALETPCTIDKLAFKFKTPISQLAAILLKMELKGTIRALGGNRFEQI